MGGALVGRLRQERFFRMAPAVFIAAGILIRSLHDGKKPQLVYE